MKRVVVSTLVTALVGVVATGSHVKAQAATHHYVVLGVGQGHGSTNFVSAIGQSGGTITGVIEDMGIVLADSSDPNFAANMKAVAGVKDAVEDVLVPWIPNETVAEASAIVPGASSLNNEPYTAYQWNMRQIGADKTAAAGFLGKGARVAVLDAGMITKHPDIAPNVNTTLARSFVPNEGVDPVKPGFNHGTHVGGIIAAAINNRGTQGVAPEAELVPVKVLAESGSGAFGWIIQGIDYASGPDVHADVINMSLGATFDRINAGGSGAGSLVSALARAVNIATARGTLVVSAAGNEATNLDSRMWSIPAQSGNGMAVSATGPYNQANFDRLASYSNYGRSVINVAAPGGEDAAGNVYDMVLAPGGFSVTSTGAISYGYYFADGTSMAAPHVSGLAALLVGRYGHMKPAQLQALIQQSAVDILKPGADPYSGNGRIDAAKALGVQ